MDETSNGRDDGAGIIDGAELSALVEPLRGAVASLEQISAVYDRLTPGAQRRTLERLPELLGEHADGAHEMRRVISDYLRRKYP